MKKQIWEQNKKKRIHIMVMLFLNCHLNLYLWNKLYELQICIWTKFPFLIIYSITFGSLNYFLNLFSQSFCLSVIKSSHNYLKFQNIFTDFPIYNLHKMLDDLIVFWENATQYMNIGERGPEFHKSLTL